MKDIIIYISREGSLPAQNRTFDLRPLSAQSGHEYQVLARSITAKTIARHVLAPLRASAIVSTPPGVVEKGRLGLFLADRWSRSTRSS
jgi:hypothetical protein